LTNGNQEGPGDQHKTCDLVVLKKKHNMTRKQNYKLRCCLKLTVATAVGFIECQYF
jgi:hypothetical protein